MPLHYTELAHTGLIAASGPDATAFLHGQLTSDLAGLAVPGTAYSGYCTAQGRLLATFLVWRLHDELLLQLPAELSEAIRARLSRYVLRARVKLADATADYRLFGLAGTGAGEVVASVAGEAPHGIHEVVQGDGLAATRVPGGRYLLLVAAAHATATRERLAAAGVAQPVDRWTALDIAAGIPQITAATQDRFVPQMLNLDRIGAVSYSKGCYPGQEIVARTHYLGRLKQRLFRGRVASDAAPVPGDPLYTAEFGTEQASGTLVSVAPVAQEYEVLAVIQLQGARNGAVHWRTPDGPLVELLDLPDTAAP